MHLIHHMMVISITHFSPSIHLTTPIICIQVTSWSNCMNCCSLRSCFWLWNICNTSMPYHSYLPWAPHIANIKSRMKKNNLVPWWGYIHTERSERIKERGRAYFSFKNFQKTPSLYPQMSEGLASGSFLLSTTQDGMVATPQSSQEQGMTSNNSYVSFIPMV
jgi:hypothetical protein